MGKKFLISGHKNKQCVDMADVNCLKQHPKPQKAYNDKRSRTPPNSYYYVGTIRLIFYHFFYFLTYGVLIMDWNLI